MTRTMQYVVYRYSDDTAHNVRCVAYKLLYTSLPMVHIKPQHQTPHQLAMFGSIIKKAMSALQISPPVPTNNARSDTQAIYGSFAESLAAEPPAKPAKPEWAHDEPKFRSLIAKGPRIHELLLAEPSEALATKFRKCSDFQKWGYVEDRNACSSLQLIWTKISNVLVTIGLDPRFPDDIGSGRSGIGENWPVNHDHYKFVTVDGVFYPPTQAMFCQVVNPVEGIIVAYDNVSPRAVLDHYEAREDIVVGNTQEDIEVWRKSDVPLPKLQFWSDFAYLQWLSHADDDSELRYVLRYNFLNDTSQFVVNTLEHHFNIPVLEWPGTTYRAGTDGFLALLGTPNGSSTGYLLINHKAELGHKTVEKITVFRHGPHEIMVFFHIVDVVKLTFFEETVD
jgi:hypothetical protein